MPALLLVCGCPHRSPLWSPDGRWLLVLAGAPGEDIEQPASQLWLVDVEQGAAAAIAPPEPRARFLASLWLSSNEFAVFTGAWENEEESVAEGSEKVWRRRREGGWKQVEVPQPSGQRSTRRLPVALRQKEEVVLVYAAGAEGLAAVSLESGKLLHEIEVADLLGPGPQGGVLILRPDSAGVLEIAALDSGFRELWKVTLPEIHARIAKRLGVAATEIAINDAALSHLPAAGAQDWVGLTVYYSDVSWREGFAGFYVRLAAADGALLAIARATGLSGRPASSGDLAWGVAAPDREKKPSHPALRAVDLRSGGIAKELELSAHVKEAIHGYALDAAGKRFALVTRGDPAAVSIYATAGGEPRRIELR